MEETDDRGRKTRTTEARDKRRGIPQGSPLSPLLANLYMRRFVLGWKMFGLERTLGTRLVTYADDLVILCRRGKAEAALQSLREIMGKLKLTVNEEKTRICKVPEGEFDFLGYTFGRMYSARTGQARIGYRPSKKSIQRAVEKVHALTDRSSTWQETTTLVGKANRTLRGWANYFSVGAVSKAYRALEQEMDRPGEARPEPRGEFVDDVRTAVVLDRMHRVEAQSVQAERVDPVFGVLDDEVSNGAGVGPVEIDGLAPQRPVARGGKVRRVGREVIPLRSEMIVDHVEQHGDAESVRRLDEGLEIIRPAVGRVGSVRVDAVVAPAPAAAEVADRHDLDRGHAKFGEMIELRAEAANEPSAV